MIVPSEPEGMAPAAPVATVTHTMAGSTDSLGYKSPAPAPRPLMPGGGGVGPIPVAAPKVLPDQPIGVQKPEQHQPENKNAAFGRGAVEASPAGAAEAGAAAECGAAEGAGLLGTIARFLPLAL